jgi:hypothetical protein
MSTRKRKDNREGDIRMWTSAEIAKMKADGTLKSGLILRDGLDAAATERLRRLYERVGHVICPTFEQWEFSFLRELTLEIEIAVWEVIADTFDAYKVERSDADRDVLVLLIAISTGGGPQHESAESQRLRTLFRQSWDAHPTFATIQAELTVVGIADCHGLESAVPKSQSLGAMFYQVRAELNRQRHSVAYLAKITAGLADLLDSLLAAGKKAEALRILKERADEICLATADGVVESWEKIPDPSQDPWSNRLVLQEIRRSREVKRPVVLMQPDGSTIPIDGRRRLRAVEKLRANSNDQFGAYCVVCDGSVERWNAFQTIVKRSDYPTPHDG